MEKTENCMVAGCNVAACVNVPDPKGYKWPLCRTHALTWRASVMREAAFEVSRRTQNGHVVPWIVRRFLYSWSQLEAVNGQFGLVPERLMPKECAPDTTIEEVSEMWNHEF